jgi:hypothetical protein
MARDMCHPRLHQVTLVGAAGGAGLLAACLKVVRLWTMRWGATDEEVARPFPATTHGPTGSKATRAITIAARPKHIWPWLIQIGQRPGRLVKREAERRARHPAAER